MAGQVLCIVAAPEFFPSGPTRAICLSFGAFAHSLDEVPVVLADLVILSWPELLACPPRVKFALFVAV